ncbi:MAG: NADPH-dependent F420 reductase [Actinobacteria bacterium]|nr:NADPH-dependent F420 reductase [Actinomycetota bacterium]MCB9388658.1 NADPH-dependent F420 reductase [Acidimicrobiia bacterium]
MNIGILGGTGPAGSGLAARFAAGGHQVLVGSRTTEKAERTIGELRSLWGSRVANLTPVTNKEAASEGDVVVLGVKWDGAIATAAEFASDLAGKTVISMGSGLHKVGPSFEPVIPEQGSLAHGVQEAAPESSVVTAFQHIPAAALLAMDEDLDEDVIVCSDHDDAAELVASLVNGIPRLRALRAGSLANALGVEAFTAILLAINIRYRGKAAIRLSGIPQ